MSLSTHYAHIRGNAPRAFTGSLGTVFRDGADRANGARQGLLLDTSRGRRERGQCGQCGQLLYPFAGHWQLPITRGVPGEFPASPASPARGPSRARRTAGHPGRVWGAGMIPRLYRWSRARNVDSGNIKPARGVEVSTVDSSLRLAGPHNARQPATQADARSSMRAVSCDGPCGPGWVSDPSDRILEGDPMISRTWEVRP